MFILLYLDIKIFLEKISKSRLTDHRVKELFRFDESCSHEKMYYRN